MANNVSKKRLEKGSKAADKMPIMGFNLPSFVVQAQSFDRVEHPGRMRTLFTDYQRARVEKLVPIFEELDPKIAKFDNLQRDIWPEKDLLLYELATHAYTNVLKRRRIAINSRTHKERLALFEQCYYFFTKDKSAGVSFYKDVKDNCRTIYQARKDEVDEAIKKARSLAALLEVCCSCRYANVGLLLCSRCNAARYCNRHCQVDDWKNGRHKELCNAVVSGEIKAEDVPRLKSVQFVPLDANAALIPAFSFHAELVGKGQPIRKS